ncbi:MAG TPA: alpha/beta hydrolase-fold protein, partial [Gemmataceae bacterium]|nr:alpha/beta hydrolase-fold protein [Gemmataceae bacterium]
MRRAGSLAGLVCLCLPMVVGAAMFDKTSDLASVNSRLQGHIFDFTHNNGADHRIWSAALQQRRDLYVYVPPGFDPGRPYPILLWLHGILEDEQAFVTDHIAEVFDRAIVQGQLPPLIIAVPDGTVDGRPSFLRPGSFFINSEAGQFEDYLLE